MLSILMDICSRSFCMSVMPVKRGDRLVGVFVCGTKVESFMRPSLIS